MDVERLRAGSGVVPAALLAVAVGLAFADTSIVMLGLPEMYAELGGSVLEISLVATTYNLVVAIAAFALLPLTRLIAPAAMATVGLGLFAATSFAAGSAGALESLLIWRGFQGVGAALILAAALPLLVALTGSTKRGRAWWAWAGIVGAAVGPALGGLLTEVFDWRAIFLAQVPVALIAMCAVAWPAARQVAVERGSHKRVPGAATANLGLVFAFGGLAGALFLGVLLVVTVWGLGPLAGAVVVSALPVAALAVRPIALAVPRWGGAAAGAVLLSAGLLALATTHSPQPALAAAALAVCGAGFGLLAVPLTSASLGSSVRASIGSISVGARHAGLVVALVAVAPILAVDLERGAESAARESAAVVLDAELPLDTKLDLAQTLAGVLDETPEGQVPELDAAFLQVGEGDGGVGGTQTDLMETIETSIGGAFSNAFIVSAALALLALIPIGVAAARERRLSEEDSIRVGRLSPVGAVGGGGLLAIAVVVGGWALLAGPGPAASAGHDPCTPRDHPSDPEGLDATVQRIGLDGLDGAACELEVSREELVLAFAPDAPGAPRIPGDDATIERATRAGMVRAVNAAEDRGDIDLATATVLRVAGRNAPVDEGLSAFRQGSSLLGSARSALEQARDGDDVLLELTLDGLEAAADAGIERLLR